MCFINNNTNVIIKEHKARLQEFLQNYKLWYNSVTRPFLPLRKEWQCQTTLWASISEHCAHAARCRTTLCHAVAAKIDLSSILTAQCDAAMQQPLDFLFKIFPFFSNTEQVNWRFSSLLFVAQVKKNSKQQSQVRSHWKVWLNKAWTALFYSRCTRTLCRYCEQVYMAYASCTMMDTEHGSTWCIISRSWVAYCELGFIHFIIHFLLRVILKVTGTSLLCHKSMGTNTMFTTWQLAIAVWSFLPSLAIVCSTQKAS